MWNTDLYGAETWTLWKVEQKHLESFEMWCWRRKEISWFNHMRNKEVLQRVKEERSILHTTKRRKTNRIGDSLRMDCLLKSVSEGKMGGRKEVPIRLGKRWK
jgi:hypothetical protein